MARRSWSPIVPSIVQRICGSSPHTYEVDHTCPSNLERSTGGLRPSRPPDHGSTHEGLSPSRGAIELWWRRATLGAYLLRAAPAARASHRGNSSASKVSRKAKPSSICATRPLPVPPMPGGLGDLCPGPAGHLRGPAHRPPLPCYAKRGRPGQGTPPDQIVYHLEGALAMHIAARQTRIDHQSCFILATNELDDTLLPCRNCSPVIKAKPKRNGDFAS